MELDVGLFLDFVENKFYFFAGVVSKYVIMDPSRYPLKDLQKNNIHL